MDILQFNHFNALRPWLRWGQYLPITGQYLPIMGQELPSQPAIFACGMAIALHGRWSVGRWE